MAAIVLVYRLAVAPREFPGWLWKLTLLCQQLIKNTTFWRPFLNDNPTSKQFPLFSRCFQHCSHPARQPQTVPIVVKTFQTLFPSCIKQFPLSGNSKEFPLFSERFQKEADFPLFWVIVMGSADLGNDETMEMVSALVAREPPHCSPDVSRERLWPPLCSETFPEGGWPPHCSGSLLWSWGQVTG